MSKHVEQHKTVRLLKGGIRGSSTGSGSSYGSGSIGSAVSKKSVSSLKYKKKQSSHAKGKNMVWVVDGEDVTPRPLTHSDPGTPKRSLFLIDEGSDSDSDLGHTETITVYSNATTLPADTTSHCTKSFLSVDQEENLSVFELQRPLRFQHEEADSMKEVMEDILETLVNICLSETDTIPLLDIPSSVLPEDAEEAEEQKQSNRRYIELCKTKLGNDTFKERGMQTFDNARKTISIQTDAVVTAETGLLVTNWDIYDCVNELSKSTAALNNEKSELTESLGRTMSQGGKERPNKSSSTDTDSLVSSLPDMDYNMDGSQSEPQPQTVMNSKDFLHSLLVMERNVVANIFQPKLALYRKLAPLPDPYRAEAGLLEVEGHKKQEEEEKDEEEVTTAVSGDHPSATTMSLLWSFSCELTRGCVVTSLSRHKERADILAVGYDSSANNKNTPGLICVWSLKNLMWPERVIYSHSAVTTLDFSPIVSAHLGVGMMDGTVAIYNVASRRCKASSSSKKHLQQVCLVSWTKQLLVSVSLDGLIKTWLLGSEGLKCTDLLQLKNVKNSKKETLTTKKKSQSIMGRSEAPGLCFHFHPVDSDIYLAGTRDGFIHLCSVFRPYFLETYEKHFLPVNSIEWSPFSPDLFLSCSSDWTVQLWRRDNPKPILGFSSSQTAVYGVRWSPKWPTVFAALKAEQLEIWDLKISILDPALVLKAGAVEFTSVQFCSEADTVVVGDTHGEVKVHQLHNLGVGSDGQVVKLEDVISSGF